MMDLDFINGLGIALTSTYFTSIVVGETKPTINEYGDEEYSLAGYLLLAGAYLIKLPFKIVGDIVYYYRKKIEVNELSEETNVIQITDFKVTKSVTPIVETSNVLPFEKRIETQANEHDDYELIV